ncbi:Restriction endonuclease subunit S [Vibrio parahaemolyticus]|uniref:restriction endonuclease subunit S n=1 Tax=Vibrio parahaemolyticus TaxID=670 RepID=UPI00320E9777
MSWPLVKLGEVAKLINGDRGKNYPSKGSFVDEGIPFINAGCLSNEHTLIEGALNYITEDKFDSLRSGKVEKGDILFCLRGSLGKFALVDTNMKGAIASSLVIIRANEKVHIDYLKHYLGSFLCQREIQAYENGAAQPNLSATDLKNFEIPLSPLAEQKRIAAILDKADAIRQKRKQAIELADEFLRSVFLDMFGDPVTNPKGWEVRPLSEFISNGPTNGLYKPSSSYGRGYRILRIDGFYSGELIEQSKLKRVETSNEESAKFKLHGRSIVINRVNSPEYLGKCAFIDELDEPTLFESNMMNLSVDEERLNPRFLVQQLQMPNIKKQIMTSAKHAVNQSSINQQDVKAFEVLVPSISLQNKFETIASSLKVNISTLKDSKSQISDLFNALSQKAFSGQL